MSLLSEAMEQCTLLTKVTSADGYGGFTEVWTTSGTFYAAIVFNSSVEAKIASIQSVTDLYTVTTSKSTVLSYHDVFRRESDNKVFRVTSDGNDNRTPASAGLDMRQVSAEEWGLASG